MLRLSKYLFLFTFLMLFSCKTRTAQNENVLLSEGFVKAEIHLYEVDGCGFLIFLEDGRKLNPLELSSAFRKEGLKIWLRYTVKKGVMTTCMAGEVIMVNDIRLRK